MSQPPSPFDPPPIRAEALPFGSQYDERRRPGILTAVGVISIVIASFGLLAAAGGLVQTFIMGTVLSRVARGMTYVPSPTTSPDPTGSTSGAAIDESVAGMSASNRAMVLAEINKRRPLPQPRQEMLEKLLADVGEDAFPFAQSNYTPERIAGSISDAGKLPSADAQDDGNHYFVLANGRIEVADDHAVFMPSRRGGQAVRVYRAMGNTAAAPPAPATMPFTLPTFSKRSLTLSYTSGLLDLVCAVYLMFIGIVVLRDAKAGRVMHLAYAVLKMLLVALAVYASWHWYTDQSKAVLGGGTPMPGTTPGAPSWTVGVQATIWTLPGVIYPLALLIVLNLPFVRAYYRTWTASKVR